VSRRLLGLISSFAALAALASCTAPSYPDSNRGFKPTVKAEPPPANATQNPVVVQGACPQIYLREGTAVFREYQRGVKKGPDGTADPSKLVFQATLERTTRQCFQTEQGLKMTVVVQGRIIPGPAGKAGTYTLPIRVAATDGDATLYSELTKFPVSVPDNLGATQFLFTKEDVVLSQGATGLTRLFAGIDEGPYNTK
jgi:hypothetical protein